MKKPAKNLDDDEQIEDEDSPHKLKETIMAILKV
jgi:hypothetical protein